MAPLLAVSIFYDGMSKFKHYEMEDDEPSNVPEGRLYVAILVRTIQDYQDWLALAESVWRRTNRPLSKNFIIELGEIRKQCLDGGFPEICEIAGVDHSEFMKRLDELDREYCINSIPFEDRVSYTSDWRANLPRYKKM